MDRSDLLAALAAGHRARDDRRLGVEFEQFVVRPDGGAVPYSGSGGVEEALHHAREWTGWSPVEEDGHLIALRADDGRSLTLEPGAQLEFGSAPCRSLAQLDRELNGYCRLLRALQERMGLGFLALGAHPTARPEEIERIPKARYDVLEPWLRDAGELGIWMMKTTCGLQVNFDHENEEDAMRKLRTTFALAPVFNALCANSALRAGEPSGYATWRGHVWTRTDATRCGIVERLMREDAGFDEYVDWMLDDVPMLFVEREGRTVDVRGRRFRDWMTSGEATAEDWDLHLSTPFPEVRFRPQIELRCADSMPPEYVMALSALVQGVFYDDRALAEAWELTAAWTHEQRVAAWHAAHRDGLAAVAPDGRRMRDLAGALLDLARLPAGEDAWLDPFRALVAAGASLGERTAARLAAPDWDGRPMSVVGSFCCAELAV